MDLNICIVAIILGGWLAGRLFTKINLPSIVGMLCFGLLAGIWIKDSIPTEIKNIEPFLKSFALIVILLRAGLGLKLDNIRKIGLTAFLMSFLPCIIEGSALMIIIKYLFDFSWYQAGLTAFIIAAVSPAVIVPSMLKLQENIPERKKRIPTLILMGASVDDVFSITLFTVFLGLSTSGNSNIGESMIHIPVSIISGIAAGLVLGYILSAVFSRYYETIRATEKTILLLMICVLFVSVSDHLHIASLLGIMTAGLILLEKSGNVASELSLKLEKIWIVSEIYLFVLIGISVDTNVVLNAGLKGMLAVMAGLIFRSAGVFFATAFSGLSWKERLFCAVAYIPKATVQAALGSVPLAYGVPGGEIILSLAALSILFTAPLGLIGIRYSGKKLLDLNFPKEE